MYTHEIPSEQWQPFLDQFSNVHRGDHIDVELIGGGAAPRSRLCDQPLQSVAAVLGSQDGTRIDVVAGYENRAETYSIGHPSQVTVTEREDGYPVALQIATSDGAVASLRFEPQGRADRGKHPEMFLG